MSLSVNEQRRNCAEMRWSSGRCWTLRLKLLRCTDPTASAFMPTALRSITSALVLKGGGRRLVAGCTFILMTGNTCSIFLVGLFLGAPLGRRGGDLRKVMALYEVSSTRCSRLASETSR